MPGNAAVAASSAPKFQGKVLSAAEAVFVGQRAGLRQRRAEKVGWAKYLEQLNSRPSLVTGPAALALS